MKFWARWSAMALLTVGLPMVFAAPSFPRHASEVFAVVMVFCAGASAGVLCLVAIVFLRESSEKLAKEREVIESLDPPTMTDEGTP